MAIKSSAVDAVASAMAEEMRVGTDPVPERDVVLHYDEARRLIAGFLAIANLKSEDIAEPKPTESAPVEPGIG